MALSIDAVKRRLSSPTVNSQPVANTGPALNDVTKQPVANTGPALNDVTKQPVANTGSALQPAVPQTNIVNYAPGGGGKIDYSDQQYANGVAASPVISQADLPKYENVDQFDFNRPYEDQLDQLQRQRADLQQGNDLATQRLQEDYGRMFRDIKQQQTDALNLDAERMAGQGILRSGIALKSAGGIGSKFGGELDEQQRSLATSLENQNTSYAQSDRQIQEQIGRAQEALTRQQQQLEESRARQAAAAAAAQRGANNAGEVAQAKRPVMNVVKDNLGKYFVVDAGNKTRSRINQNQLSALGETNNINTISDLASAGSFFGGDYVKNANALARKLGGNLGGQATLDTRLGFRDIGRYRG